MDDIREGLWNIHSEKKEGLQETNENFIHSKEYGFIVLASH